MSRHSKTNCYNCGKPVYGDSEADWNGHVFCCSNCRDAYERKQIRQEHEETMEKVALVAAGFVAFAFCWAHPIIGLAAASYTWAKVKSL